MPPPLHTLKIWGAGVYSPRSYRADFVFLFVRHATMLSTESLDALNLGGTGISPPDKSPPGQKTPGEKVPRGDIFYCSGCRQLNHFSFTCDRSFSNVIDCCHSQQANHFTVRGNAQRDGRPLGGQNSGPTFRRLQIKVHRIKYACAGVTAVCSAVFCLKIACCVPEIFAINSQSLWGGPPKF